MKQWFAVPVCSFLLTFVFSPAPAYAQSAADTTLHAVLQSGDEDEWNTNSIRSFGKTSKLPPNSNLVLGLATQKFVCPYNGDFIRGVGRGHDGLDINLPMGAPVKSAFDGIVRYAQRNKGGYGNLVIVRHANGLETYYAHLSTIKVRENEEVSAGEVVGLGGSTGRSSGPHLHFELRYKDVPLDPLKILDYFGTKVIADTVNYSEVTRFDADKKKSGRHWRRSTRGDGKGGYTIRKGDTLSDLARRHGTTVKKLCSINRISPKALLRSGHKLKLK